MKSETPGRATDKRTAVTRDGADAGANAVNAPGGLRSAGGRVCSGARAPGVVPRGKGVLSPVKRGLPARQARGWLTRQRCSCSAGRGPRSGRARRARDPPRSPNTAP